MLDEQGVPYVGYLWYLFELDVPQRAGGKPLHVFAPIVVTEAWVWCNGEYVGHRPYLEGYIRPQPLESEVTPHLRPGRNVLGVRVYTSPSRIQVAEGFQGPLFLYSPR